MTVTQFITLGFLLITITQLCLADNPSAIVAPYSGPDPKYIVVSCFAGLANRLRVLAAFMWICEKKFDGAHLVYVWDVNDACPGHFLELFEPINNVIFTTSESAPGLYKNAIRVYENTTLTARSLFLDFNVTDNHSGVEKHMYSKMMPLKKIMYKVTKFVNEYNLCSGASMHIRATDMKALLGAHKSPGPLHSRYNEIENLKDGELMFLMTDDPDLQRKTMEKYPKKVVVYRTIPNVTEQVPFSHTSGSSASVALPIDHRYTTLEHTIIDVLISAHTRKFRGSPYSSLGELVVRYNKIGKTWWGWCFKK